jgi:type II secretory pathway component PulK
MTPICRRQRGRVRRGFAFVVTLWLIVAMVALALSLTQGARTRRYQAANLESAAKARAAQQAALNYILAALEASEGLAPDEPTFLASAVQVGDAAWWILVGDSDADGEMDFALVSEAGKIDLNTAPLSVLRRLPEMPSDVAAAIIDWRDADETVTEDGAESDFYLRKASPYNAKNAPLETTGELRLVAGVTDELFEGEDANLNGLLDPSENDGGDTPPADDRDGTLARGLGALTTSHVQWPSQDESGPLNVNSASEGQIRDALAKVLDAGRAEDLAQTIDRRRPFDSIFRLYYRCGLSREEFAQLEPLLQVAPANQGDQAAPFRLDVNGASTEALACLPGLEPADVEALIQARAANAQPASMAWMIDAIDAEKLQTAAAAGVIGRSYQYTADILTVSGDGRGFARIRYVIDVSQQRPRVVHRLDLTARGWPLNEQIRSRLRSGQDLTEVLADVRITAQY